MCEFSNVDVCVVFFQINLPEINSCRVLLIV